MISRHEGHLANHQTNHPFAMKSLPAVRGCDPFLTFQLFATQGLEETCTMVTMVQLCAIADSVGISQASQE